MAFKRISQNPKYICLTSDVKKIDGIEDGAILDEYTIGDLDECGRFIASYKFYNNCWHTTASQISDSNGNILNLQTEKQGEIDLYQPLLDIIKELKKINIHFALINDYKVSNSDIEE